MIPTYTQIEIPLLEALIDLGGVVKPKQIYSVVAAKFPELTEDDLEEQLADGHARWDNRVQWARQRLIETGDMASPQRGVWAITDQGRKRVAENGKTESTSQQAPVAPVSLVEIHEKYELQFRSKLLDKLHEMTPAQFEHFAKHLLTKYGFVQMTVTQVSRDGGIDGHGRLKVGLARMDVAFQCKRWEGNVPRPEVDKFLGAIQGSFEQGIFFTTSDFSSGRRKPRLKRAPYRSSC